MASKKPTQPKHPNFKKLTVFKAKKIVTMCDAMPVAKAAAVGGGRIVAVGSMDTLKPWMDRYDYEIDDRFKN